MDVGRGMWRLVALDYLGKDISFQYVLGTVNGSRDDHVDIVVDSKLKLSWHQKKKTIHLPVHLPLIPPTLQAFRASGTAPAYIAPPPQGSRCTTK